MMIRLFLFPFRILGKLFSRFSGAVDLEVSDSYYYAKRSGEIIYSPMGNWFELGYIKMPADKKTFRPIANNFGKDKDHVFHKSAIVPGADVSSFNIENQVIKDRAQVYAENYYEATVVEGADPETYHYLQDTRKWAKDKSFYYLHDKKTNTDYSSTQIFKNDLVADKNFIYEISTEEQEHNTPSNEITGWPEPRLYKREAVNGPIRELSAVYILMGNTVYANDEFKGFKKIAFEKITHEKVIDDQHLIINDTLLLNGEKFPSPEVDLATFRIIKTVGTFVYSSDRNHLYVNGKTIEGADRATFTPLKHGYAKDERHVYYDHEIVKEANVHSFAYDEKTGDWKDGRKIFRNGNKI